MRYRPLELGESGQPRVPNQFSEESTLFCPSSERLLLTVMRNSVYVELGQLREGEASSLGSIQWQGEFRMLPIVASLGRLFDAVRVRNFDPESPGAVILVVD
jgi:hypothetical protein